MPLKECLHILAYGFLTVNKVFFVFFTAFFRLFQQWKSAPEDAKKYKRDTIMNGGTAHGNMEFTFA